MHTDTIRMNLKKIQHKNPLILSLTNFVVMNLTANALLAVGASPIMAHAQDELEQLISQCHAVNLNIGTLDTQWFNSVNQAATLAARFKKPVIFDPVGVGATDYRRSKALELIQNNSISVIRGNAAEIIALATNECKNKGVDSPIASQFAIESAHQLSLKYQCAVVISGVIDYCIKDKECINVTGGNELMSRVTGMGCVATALIAAFSSLNEAPLSSATYAMQCMKQAGELASVNAQGPANFSINFIDALYQLTLL